MSTITSKFSEFVLEEVRVRFRSCYILRESQLATCIFIHRQLVYVHEHPVSPICEVVQLTTNL